MSLTFFLIEGKSDKAVNRYIRGHQKSIEKYLAQRGVHYKAFNIVHTSLFGACSLKNLILRQCPTLDKEELGNRIKEVKEKLKRGNKSRLLYINGVTATDDGRFIADILCEDDFNREGDYQTTLYKFLDNVVRCNIARYSNAPATETTPCQNENNGTPHWDNSEFLACDLLSGGLECGECNSLSPIRFDNRFNMTLPLYPQISVKLKPLHKALYILFLNHPEGIMPNEIQDYESELKNIYKSVSGRKSHTTVNRMLKAMAESKENPLHKSITTIRRCFLGKLRFEIASNYIPIQDNTKAYRIQLDKALVEIAEIKCQ